MLTAHQTALEAQKQLATAKSRLKDLVLQEQQLEAEIKSIGKVEYRERSTRGINIRIRLWNWKNIVCIPNEIGFEVSREAIKHFKRRKIEVVNNTETIEKNSFDIVLCRHVLEHIPSPLRTLWIIKSFLKIIYIRIR